MSCPCRIHVLVFLNLTCPCVLSCCIPVVVLRRCSGFLFNQLILSFSHFCISIYFSFFFLLLGHIGNPLLECVSSLKELRPLKINSNS